jgi:hypothetical protein
MIKYETICEKVNCDFSLVNYNRFFYIKVIPRPRPCCPATAPKHNCSRGDLHGGMGQNTSNSV